MPAAAFGWWGSLRDFCVKTQGGDGILSGVKQCYLVPQVEDSDLGGFLVGQGRSPGFWPWSSPAESCPEDFSLAWPGPQPHSTRPWTPPLRARNPSCFCPSGWTLTDTL